MKVRGWFLAVTCLASASAMAAGLTDALEKITGKVLGSEPPAQALVLRDQVSADAVAYLRVANPANWLQPSATGDLAPLKGNKSLAKSLADIGHGVRQNLLPELAPFTGPILPLLEPATGTIEAIVTLPPQAPPTMAQVLFAIPTNHDSLEQANAWLTELTGALPELTLAQPLSADQPGQLQSPVAPLFLHFEPERKLLLAAGGMALDPAAAQNLFALESAPESPMQAFEQRLDASGEGTFLWVNLQSLVPLAQPMIPLGLQKTLSQWGLLGAKSLAIGMGRGEGMGRMGLLVDLPKAGYHEFLPAAQSTLNIQASGEPGIVVNLNLPLDAWWASVEKILHQENQQTALAEMDKFKEEFATETGLDLGELLASFGPEWTMFFDHAGEYLAVRRRNPEFPTKLLAMLEQKQWGQHVEKNLNGKTYHHLTFQNFGMPEDMLGSGEPLLDILFKWANKIHGHAFWIQEGDYLIFADTPQMLIERAQASERVELQTWLNEQQGQNPTESLVLISARMEKMPRRLYSLYLQTLIALADFTEVAYDPFALPTARELDLPEAGSYGLQLEFGEHQAGLLLNYESNPLELLVASPTGLMATAAIGGVMAAVAIPAYTDYLERAQQKAKAAANPYHEPLQEAVLMLVNLKTPAEEYLATKGTFPTPDEIGASTEGQHTHNLQNATEGLGFQIEFKDPALPGRLMMVYDAETAVWECKGENLDPEYLPVACQ